MHHLPFHIVAAAFALCLSLIGCQTKDAAPDEPAQTPPAASTTESPSTEGADEMATLQVTSTAFQAGTPIPAIYTCDGDDISPPLAWSPGPEGTQSYALIMDDPDAPRGTWVHWVMWNIPGPTLEENITKADRLPDGAMQGVNSWPKTGYGGPCPPSGSHRYFFKVFALDTTLSLSSRTTKDDLLNAMEGHILAEGELMGTYSRG